MSILNIFKKKPKAELLSKIDFGEWAKKCSDEELEKLVDKIGEGIEYDYTDMCWGHAFNTSQRIGNFIQYGSGFYGLIIGRPRPTVGSILLIKTQGGKIGRYMILNIEWERDPDDMFWAYIVGVGYKETQ